MIPMAQRSASLVMKRGQSNEARLSELGFSTFHVGVGPPTGARTSKDDGRGDVRRRRAHFHCPQTHQHQPKMTIGIALEKRVMQEMTDENAATSLICGVVSSG